MWNEIAFENAEVQKFIKRTDLHFDVIVAEDFFHESLYMFAHKHKAPLVTICKFLKFFDTKFNISLSRFIYVRKTISLKLGPFGVTEFIDRQQGLLSPPSFVSQNVSNGH